VKKSILSRNFNIMETNFFKIVLPVIAIIISIGSSITIQANTKKDPKTVIPGYYNTNPSIPNPCNLSIQCSNNVGPLCTTISDGQIYQAFGKEFSTDTTCSIILYRL